MDHVHFKCQSASGPSAEHDECWSTHPKCLPFTSTSANIYCVTFEVTCHHFGSQHHQHHLKQRNMKYVGNYGKTLIRHNDLRKGQIWCPIKDIEHCGIFPH